MAAEGLMPRLLVSDRFMQVALSYHCGLRAASGCVLDIFCQSRELETPAGLLPQKTVQAQQGRQQTAHHSRPQMIPGSSRNGPTRILQHASPQGLNVAVVSIQSRPPCRASRMPRSNTWLHGKDCWTCGFLHGASQTGRTTCCAHREIEGGRMGGASATHGAAS